MRYKKLITAALLTALCASIGYMFLYVPNVEFITAGIFISGFFMGPAFGALIGMLAEFLFSAFNPYGASAPPLLLAQVISMSLVGFTGGIVRTRYWLGFSKVHRHIITGFCGLILTLIYDILTTFSFALFISGGNSQKLISIFSTGSVFYLLHILINTVIFAALVPILLDRLRLLQSRRVQ